MTKKSCIILLLLGLLMLADVPALADRLTTPEELYAQYPNLGFTLPADPATEPLLSLVNRDNLLPSNFKPKVTTPKVAQKRHADIDLQPEAAAALEAMFVAAQAEGLELVAVSGYRSYRKQKTLYARSVERNGQEKADRMSACAGASEHQLGLAMDLSCASLNHELTSKFVRKAEGKWVQAHCVEFGFIIRYEEDWASVTGYQGEPWHIRYVGLPHATMISKLGIPFETYSAYLRLVWQYQAGITQ